MIQIDMQMPKSCIDCPFKEQEYGEGECLADKENRCTYGESSGRQEWCPLQEQEAMNVDAFVQWCIDSHIIGDATVRGIKYWAGKYKETKEGR